MTASIEKTADSISFHADSNKELHLNSKLKSFLNQIVSSITDNNSFELTELVNHVKTNVVDVALRDKDFSNFHKFIRSLEIVFSNHKHKVHLMEIFREMILIERVANIEKTKKLRESSRYSRACLV